VKVLIESGRDEITAAAAGRQVSDSTVMHRPIRKFFFFFSALIDYLIDFTVLTMDDVYHHNFILKQRRRSHYYRAIANDMRVCVRII
jgi:hypothetical protein